MAMDSGGVGGGAKRLRVGELDGRSEAVASDAVPVDRISALPDELRLRVLTHLPLKDAIRTGALARGWRGLWKGRWAHRTSLVVHLRSRVDLHRELDALAREPRPRRRLERFSLIVTCKLKAPELRRFLDYAAECGVEDLHVETAAENPKFHLPLSSPTLACLSLRFIGFSHINCNGARPFHVLEVVKLAWVSFCREGFGKMMVLCPSLRTLDLRHCSCNGELGRLPPNLRSLTIADCDGITTLSFVRVSALRSFRYSGPFSNLPLPIPQDATLFDLYIVLYETIYDWPMKEWNMDQLRKYLPKDLSSLSVLTICDKSLMDASVMSADGGIAQLPSFNLHSLKELYLLLLERKAVNLSSLYQFLRTIRCPNLERLFVKLPAYRDSMVRVNVLEEPPEDGLDNLVMVKVMNFNWCPTEVKLVSFLVRKARSLQKMLIVSHNVTPVDSLGAPEADLLVLKEALVNGKIMLTKSDNAATQLYHDAFINLF